MRYTFGVIAERKAHEYRNEETGEYEVIRRYGAYDVVETFLQPDGQILFLAFNVSASQPWAVGVYNTCTGVYWSDGDEARRFYAAQTARSFGLVVDKEGTATVLPASRDYVTDLATTIKEASGARLAAMGGPDRDAQSAAEETLEEKALSLAKALQRFGVLSRPVFGSWETVG